MICGEFGTDMLVLRVGIQFYAVLQPSDLWPAMQDYDDGNAVVAAADDDDGVD